MTTATDFIYSFEVYPPKKMGSIVDIYKALGDLAKLKPDSISVTYGAGGGAATAHATVEICTLLRNTLDTNTVAHLPGINLTREQVDSLLHRLLAHNITEILALRGDRRPEDDHAAQEGDFHYASELVEYIKAHELGNQFTISGACYPETHQEAASPEADIENLKKKVDAGTELLISQLFFDNEAYFRFLERCKKAGIAVPIQAGIMPLTSVAQATGTIMKLTNPHMPKALTDLIEKYRDDKESFRAAGIDYANQQIAQLIEAGADGVHLYIMNNPKLAAAITKETYPLLGRTTGK